MEPTGRKRSSDEDLERLLACLRSELPELLTETGVVLAYLHGSTVSGFTHPWSDVDIALIVGEALPPAKQLKLMLSLQVDLAERCGIDNADVRTINDAPLILKGKVVTEGILLYEGNEQIRIDFEVETMTRYFDYLPVYREMQETFLATVRERGLHG